jgi:hypothetical protein
VLIGYTPGCLFETQQGQTIDFVDAYRRIHSLPAARDVVRAFNPFPNQTAKRQEHTQRETEDRRAAAAATLRSWSQRVQNDQALSSAARRLLVFIAVAVIEEGKTAFRIGIPELSRRSGIPERTVNRYLKQAETLGYLHTSTSSGKFAPWRTPTFPSDSADMGEFGMAENPDTHAIAACEGGGDAPPNSADMGEFGMAENPDTHANMHGFAHVLIHDIHGGNHADLHSADMGEFGMAENPDTHAPAASVDDQAERSPPPSHAPSSTRMVHDAIGEVGYQWQRIRACIRKRWGNDLDWERVRILYDMRKADRDREQKKAQLWQEQREYREYLRGLKWTELQGEAARMGNTAALYRREGKRSYKHFEWKHDYAQRELEQRAA